MNWHTRYSQQANWTRELRRYVFEKLDLKNARRVLEVGCGSGAILSELPNIPGTHGLDIDPVALAECRTRVPDASLIRANALQLPYLEASFDIVYSHFLLLWVREPLQSLQEMKRVTRSGGYIIAFAEPDYLSRVDQPEVLIPLGKWQTEALVRQGADPSLGARLAELFFEAGIDIVETGIIQSQRNEPSPEEWELEWDVIRSDLAGSVAAAEIQTMKLLDQQARKQKTRTLYVPTHFAWGRI